MLNCVRQPNLRYKPRSQSDLRIVLRYFVFAECYDLLEVLVSLRKL